MTPFSPCRHTPHRPDRRTSLAAGRRRTSTLSYQLEVASSEAPGGPIPPVAFERLGVTRASRCLRDLMRRRCSRRSRGRRTRLAEIHRRFIEELKAGLAPELVEEPNGSPCLSGRPRRPTPSCPSPRPSASASWRVSSTASRPPSSLSRRPRSSSCRGSVGPPVASDGAGAWTRGARPDGRPQSPGASGTGQYL